LWTGHINALKEQLQKVLHPAQARLAWQLINKIDILG